MALYKRIAGAADEATLAREASAAEDRYGAAPPAFRTLLELARLRLLARALGVKALQRRGDELAATLEKRHALDPSKVLDLLKAGALVAAGPDAFRLPKAFAHAAPETLAERARGVLLSLAKERAVPAGAA